MTNSIADLAGAECVFIIGSNAAESHPIIMGQIYKAMDAGATVIVVDPRRTAVADNADMHLSPEPGTDIPLIAGMMRHIVDSGLHKEDFIQSRVEGFDALLEFLEDWPVEEAARHTGIKPQIIRQVAEIYAGAREAAIVYCMGITQHVCGSDNVAALCDLAMLCGHVGTEHSGVYPLRGQNNVQGACDMGSLPNVYPGYQSVADAAVKQKFEAAWGRSLSDTPGLTLMEMINGAGREVRGLYIMGENPALSDPDVTQVIEALQRFDFLIVQDIFMTETARFADLVLPACSFAEKSGTFTNTERRFQLVRKAVDPIAATKTDLEILCLLGIALGLDFTYGGPGEVLAEINRVAPSYAGISYGRLERQGLQWPCPNDEHPGTRFLHQDRFTRGKGLFVVPNHTPPHELPDGDYPFYLNTGRMFAHYHTGTMTRRSGRLNREAARAYGEINPEDARSLGVAEGDALHVSSRRGSIVVDAMITDRIRKGSIFIPFHFTEARVNTLTNPVLDPRAQTPEYKVCAVRVKKEGS
jgi:formate dehydrogenase major subunit/formate dehydrogenase alpha subunit